MKTYVFSKEVALIVVEAIQGEGGNIVPPPVTTNGSRRWPKGTTRRFVM